MKQITSLGPKECILCTTQEECDIIMDMMHDAGLEWADGSSYKSYRQNNYFPNNCYYPHAGQYSSKKYYEKEGFTIYPASDFIEKERQPKQGERVLARDYELEKWEEVIFLCEIPQAYAPYVCAPSYDESDYLKGKKVSVDIWKQIKQLSHEVKSTYTLELTEEQYKKVQDLING